MSTKIMHTKTITKRQKQVLDYIENYINRNSYAPSLEEIKKHLKLSSFGTVHKHIENLQKAGRLRKSDNQARAIELINKGGGRDTTTIPMLGTITAGEPLETYEIPETITISKNLLSRGGEHFALKVSGDSMIDEGIFDGDTVVIRRQQTAENGDRVVALINGSETTLKKIYQEKSRFRLQPANPNLKPIYVKNLDVQGKVVSIIRSLEKPAFETNKILCGDVVSVMKKIPDNSVHLAITSPPYNVGKDYDNHNDRMGYQEYLDWLDEVWRETKRGLAPGGRFALNIAPTGIKDFVPLHHDFANQFRKIGMKFRTEVIWYKQTMLKRTAWGSFKSPGNPHIVPSWEYVLIFTKENDRLDGDTKNADITKEEFMKFSDGFWQISPETRRNGHPAPFPEDLIYRLIKFYSYKGNTVLDPFGGTGTVALVSYKTGRHFMHIDISDEYNEVANRRLAREKNLVPSFNNPQYL